MIFDLHNEQDTERQAFTGVKPTFFEGATNVKWMGKKAMEFSTGGAKAAAMTGSILFPSEDVPREQDPGRIVPSKEDFNRFIDTYIEPAQRYWTPPPNEVGHAAKILGNLTGMAFAGGPGNIALNAAMNTGTNLIDQGVDPTTATIAGIGAGAVGYATSALPQTGKTLLEKGGLILANPFIGTAQDLALKKGLEAQNYKEQAAAINPFDPVSRGTDLLVGTLFGGLAHFAKIKEQLPVEVVDAVDSIHNQAKVDAASPFKESANPAVSDAHVAAYNKALTDVNAGRPVDVSPIIRERMGETHGELEFRTGNHPEEIHVKEVIGKEIKALAEDLNTAEDRPPLKDGQLTHHDTPEIIKAREELANIRSTHEIDTPERIQLRQSIADELYGTGAALKNREAYIVLGPPAAGKSTIAEPLAEQKGGLVIDSDKAKERLPEYGKGEGAGAVHRESDTIRDAVLNKALDAGDNIVMPLVGRTADNVRAIKQLLQDEGYTVHLRLVDLHPDRAAQRAVSRFNETGRFVDPHYIVNEVGLLPRENYRTLKQEGGWKTYEAHTTDVAPGESPRLIESGPAAEYTGTEAGRIGTEPHSNPEIQGTEAHPVADPTVTDPQQTNHIAAGPTEHATTGHDPLARDVETLLREHGDVPLIHYDADGHTVATSARQVIEEARADFERTKQLEKAYERAALCLGLD